MPAIAAVGDCKHIWRAIHLIPGTLMVQACTRCEAVCVSFAGDVVASCIDGDEFGGYYLFEPQPRSDG